MAAAAALVVIALGGLFGGPSPRRSVDMVIFGVGMAVILVLTATGVGAILGWVAELTLSNIAATAGMFVRALPVVLLDDPGHMRRARQDALVFFPWRRK